MSETPSKLLICSGQFSSETPEKHTERKRILFLLDWAHQGSICLAVKVESLWSHWQPWLIILNRFTTYMICDFNSRLFFCGIVTTLHPIINVHQNRTYTKPVEMMLHQVRQKKQENRHWAYKNTRGHVLTVNFSIPRDGRSKCSRNASNNAAGEDDPFQGFSAETICSLFLSFMNAPNLVLFLIEC